LAEADDRLVDAGLLQRLLDRRRSAIVLRPNAETTWLDPQAVDVLR
jgi:hypothetical protein